MKIHTFLLLATLVFGLAIGISSQSVFAQINDNIAIGVLGKDVNDTDSVGVVYLYDTDGTLLQTLYNPDGNIHGQFGQTIDYANNKILVAAPWIKNNDSKNVGSIYVFEGSDISPMLTTRNPLTVGSSEFGWSLVSFDDKIIASSPAYSINALQAVGIVHIFDAISGDLVFSIQNPEPNNADAFGNYVIYHDGKIIIGSPGNDAEGNETSGSVYLFDATTGSLLKTINNPEPAISFEFGNSITVSNNHLVIGAPKKQVENKMAAGGVYIFDISTGSLLKTINHPDPDDAEFFGKRVIGMGNSFAVAAPDAGLFKSGKVFIFNGETGSLIKTIDSPQKNFPIESGYDNEFGDAMAYKDGKLVIGDRGKVLNNTINSGSVYVYDTNTWKLLQTIDNPNPTKHDSFGNSISFVGHIEQPEKITNSVSYQIPSQSYTYDYYSGSIKFDTDLDGLYCGDVFSNPKTNTARSLNIDKFTNDFFIAIGKTNSGDYNYLQMSLPETTKTKATPSYLLDFRNDTAKIRGEFYQDYDQMAIYLEADGKSRAMNSDNYKRFFIGQSLHVSPSSESLGPGQYNFHAILFQSDRVNWIKDEVCAISLNWPVTIDVNGNIITDNPQTQVGRIYPVETNKDALAETDKIIEDANKKQSSNSTYWNVGNIKWLKENYSPYDTAVLQVIDPDMNLNPESIDTFDAKVWSESDPDSIIALTVTETDEATGIFKGTVTFTTTDESSGHRLRIIEGDTINALYEDKTLPSSYSTSDILVLTTESKIKQILSPLKQQKSGIFSQDVICKNEFKKIFKNDGSVICVKPLSAEKLMLRGYI